MDLLADMMPFFFAVVALAAVKLNTDSRNRDDCYKYALITVISATLIYGCSWWLSQIVTYTEKPWVVTIAETTINSFREAPIIIDHSIFYQALKATVLTAEYLVPSVMYIYLFSVLWKSTTRLYRVAGVVVMLNACLMMSVILEKYIWDTRSLYQVSNFMFSQQIQKNWPILDVFFVLSGIEVMLLIMGSNRVSEYTADWFNHARTSVVGGLGRSGVNDLDRVRRTHRHRD